MILQTTGAEELCTLKLKTDNEKSATTSMKRHKHFKEWLQDRVQSLEPVDASPSDDITK